MIADCQHKLKFIQNNINIYAGLKSISFLNRQVDFYAALERYRLI